MKFRRVLLGTCALAFISAQAHAQTAPAASAPAPVVPAQDAAQATTLDEIVVTARKISENVQDIPVAITAFSGETLSRRGIADTTQLYTITPGLFTAPIANRVSGLNIAIRSQSQEDAQSVYDPSVGLYFDGAYMARSNGLASGLFDVERVEVLRGPQGTLYGRNTTGGAIGFYTKRPILGEFGGYGKATSGNYRALTAEGALNIPFGDTFAIRASVYRNQRGDSWERNTFLNRDTGTQDSWGYRLNALWQPTDRFESFLSLYGTEDTGIPANTFLRNVGVCGQPNQTVGPVPLVVPTTFDCANGGAGATAVRAQLANPRRFQGNDLTSASVRSLGATSIVSYDLTDNIQIKNTLAYRRLKDFEYIELDSIATAVDTASRFSLDEEQLTNETQITGKALADRLAYAAGLYYIRETAFEGTQSKTLGATTLSYLQGDVTNTSYSAYAQGSYDLTDRLTFTLGARYTSDDREVIQYNRQETAAGAVICTMRDAAGAFLPNNACVRPLEETFENYSYNISVDYEINDDVRVYAAHRRGYRTGGINLRGQSAADVTPTNPEIVRDIETGLKSEFHWGEMRGRFNAALFYQWYDDIQRSLPTLSPIAGGGFITGTSVLNAASANIYGGELELTLIPVTNLNINLGLSSSIARYNEFDRTVLIGGVPTVQDLSYNRFYGSPDFSFTGSARYTIPLTNGFADAIDLEGDAYWQDTVNFAVTNTPSLVQEPYWLLGARVTAYNVGGSGADLAVFVKNLTDETYIAGKGADFSYTLGYAGAVYAAPRTYGLTLTYKFGSDR